MRVFRSSETDKSEMIDTDKAASPEESGPQKDAEESSLIEIKSLAKVFKGIFGLESFETKIASSDFPRLGPSSKSEMILTDEVASPNESKSKMVYRNEAPSLKKENAFLQSEPLEMDKEELPSDKVSRQEEKSSNKLVSFPEAAMDCCRHPTNSVHQRSQNAIRAPVGLDKKIAPPVAVGVVPRCDDDIIGLVKDDSSFESFGAPKYPQKASKWMIRRAEHCMIIAAVLVSLAYAAILRPLGESEGFSLLESDWISTFLILNALAFILSSSSILLFLSVLTSQYNTRDLLRLETRLDMGFIMLISAILGKVLSFSLEYRSMYPSRKDWFTTVIFSFTIVIAIFGLWLIYEVWAGKNSTFAPSDDDNNEESPTSSCPHGNERVTRELGTTSQPDDGRECLIDNSQRGVAY